MLDAVGDPSWETLEHAPARALVLAHRSLVVGGLAVGAVITDRAGSVVAEGRNHAYDPPSGDDPLERTPVAHAEMNAMAGLVTGIDTGVLTLWSTQQPCPMCRAAADFIGIGRVVALATDPSAPDDRVAEGLADEWVLLATAMFLVGPLSNGGADHPTISANRVLEPEAVDLAERRARCHTPAAATDARSTMRSTRSGRTSASPPTAAGGARPADRRRGVRPGRWPQRVELLERRDERHLRHDRPVGDALAQLAAEMPLQSQYDVTSVASSSTGSST